MLDMGLVVYVSLVCLVFWRFAFKYECCGRWLVYLNYMALLYLLMAVAAVYLTVMTYFLVLKPVASQTYPEAAGLWDQKWLKPITMFAPPLVLIAVFLGGLQTYGHIKEIKKRSAESKHDRAVQLLAIPTLYAVMSLASMLPVLELVAGRVSTDVLNPNWYIPSSLLEGIMPVNLAPWEAGRQWATWRSETSLYVADLFEAWGLFQFGRLVLDQVEESIAITSTHKDEESRQSQLKQELLESHRAVSSLTWIGTSLFVVTCIVQSAFSAWPYLGGSQNQENTIMMNLTIAGNITSCAAIYNLVIVEHAFRRHIDSMSPRLKFLSVKLLLSLSYLQKTIFSAAKSDTFRPWISWIPLVGRVAELSDIQLEVFFPSLVILECLLVSILHMFVWRPTEEWYITVGTENEPLATKN